jgi:hypothetical protein
LYLAALWSFLHVQKRSPLSEAGQTADLKLIARENAYIFK